MILLGKQQTLRCLLCKQPDYKAHNYMKTAINSTSWKENINDPIAAHPMLVRKDSYYNKNNWSNKIKRNFDEIDKASVSFGILNPLV
ncbi:CG13565 [Drosophila busckii]|uniref:CG13565 n=2 Tax=Drosophila busckii TaxID=30019 RepID=A0A0M3QVL8_DROBS|nr:CG13565 [Drosophila busckii]